MIEFLVFLWLLIFITLAFKALVMLVLLTRILTEEMFDLLRKIL